ncbi:MAG: Asp23/Gls24 family envelope stress response protein [Oscillospiraceae bacterium]|nr:Asp23/Gls24 family envelope stress response protein [Oscillospiraceae bacterium]
MKQAGQGDTGTVETLPGVDIELDVIARVAAKSALGASGVLSLENTFADGIAAALGKHGHARGVRVVSEGGGCVFHISVVTRYGENIPEIAWKLQERVKHSVEELVGARVKRVNVLIAGIRDEGAKRRPKRGAGQPV